jgi:hypothetical protein
MSNRCNNHIPGTYSKLRFIFLHDRSAGGNPTIPKPPVKGMSSGTELIHIPDIINPQQILKDVNRRKVTWNKSKSEGPLPEPVDKLFDLALIPSALADNIREDELAEYAATAYILIQDTGLHLNTLSFGSKICERPSFIILVSKIPEAVNMALPYYFDKVTDGEISRYVTKTIESLERAAGKQKKSQSRSRNFKPRSRCLRPRWLQGRANLLNARLSNLERSSTSLFQSRRIRKLHRG